MPYLNKNLLATSLQHVKGSQSVLLLMYNEPWCVQELRLKAGTLNVIEVQFQDGPCREIGFLKDAYRDDLRGKYVEVKQWKVTGGDELPDRVFNGAVRLTYFGLNLHLLILDQKPVKQLPVDVSSADALALPA